MSFHAVDYNLLVMLMAAYRTLAAIGSVIVLIVSSSCTQSEIRTAPEPVTTAADGIVEVAFCELVDAPERYLERRVRVRAVFCDCFENAQLFSIACPTAKKVWVEGTQAPCSDKVKLPPSRRAASDNPGEQIYGSWNFGVVAVGRLTGINGKFGHMGGFDHKFEIGCLESKVHLDRKGSIPPPGTPEHARIADFEAGTSK